MKNEIELLKEQLNSISEQIKALESNPRFEIIKDEVIKVGGYDCKKIDHDNYSIGCKKFHRNDFNNAKRLLEKSGCNELYFDSIGFSVELINKILSL